MEKLETLYLPARSWPLQRSGVSGIPLNAPLPLLTPELDWSEDPTTTSRKLRQSSHTKRLPQGEPRTHPVPASQSKKNPAQTRSSEPKSPVRVGPKRISTQRQSRNLHSDFDSDPGNQGHKPPFELSPPFELKSMKQLLLP